MTAIPELREVARGGAAGSGASIDLPQSFGLMVRDGRNATGIAAVPPPIISREQVDAVKRLVAPRCTDDELELFVNVCNRLRLDPFARQIYAIKRKNRRSGDETMTIQVAIDAFRLIAQRSGEYEGQTPPQWGELITTGTASVRWHEVWPYENKNPYAAKIGVYRRGFKEVLIGIARWQSYAQTYEGRPQGQWGTMPDHMLAKVAEALALRKAFPMELSGVYTHEEMDTNDAPVRRAKPAPKPETKEEQQPEVTLAQAREMELPWTNTKDKKLWEHRNSTLARARKWIEDTQAAQGDPTFYAPLHAGISLILAEREAGRLKEPEKKAKPEPQANGTTEEAAAAHAAAHYPTDDQKAGDAPMAGGPVEEPMEPAPAGKGPPAAPSSRVARTQRIRAMLREAEVPDVTRVEVYNWLLKGDRTDDELVHQIERLEKMIADAVGRGEAAE